jgi:hypothetical protein
MPQFPQFEGSWLMSTQLPPQQAPRLPGWLDNREPPPSTKQAFPWEL